MSGERHDKVEEEIRQLRAALRQSQRELSSARRRTEEVELELRRTKRSLEDSWYQLDTLRKSESWRVGSFLRKAKNVARKLRK